MQMTREEKGKVDEVRTALFTDYDLVQEIGAYMSRYSLYGLFFHRV